jgi:hypothetical protein
MQTLRYELKLITDGKPDEVMTAIKRAVGKMATVETIKWVPEDDFNDAFGLKILPPKMPVCLYQFTADGKLERQWTHSGWVDYDGHMDDVEVVWVKKAIEIMARTKLPLIRFRFTLAWD